MEELELKVGPLDDEAQMVGEMQRKLDAQSRRLDLMKRALEAIEADLMEKDNSCGRLELELSSARAGIGRGERVMRDFVELVCAGYSSLLHKQAPSYRPQRNALLGDAQAHGEYLCGYRVCMGENDQAFNNGETDSDEERGGFSPLLQHDGEIAGAPPPAKSS